MTDHTIAAGALVTQLVHQAYQQFGGHASWSTNRPRGPITQATALRVARHVAREGSPDAIELSLKIQAALAYD
jgi:hypothetical protein